MKVIRKWLMAGLAAALVACGGGGSDAGSSAFGGNGTGGTDGGTNGGTTTSTATTIEVLASNNTVSTAGDQVTITAVVKSSTNVGIASAAVAFESDTGVLQGVSTATDANGVATAKFSVSADKSNRSAIITVKSGTVIKTMSLPITGSKISLTGPTAAKQGETHAMTIKAVDGKGTPVANATVTVSSSLGNTLAQASGPTDANGLFTFNYTATNPGTDTLSFTGVGATLSSSVSISGEDFVFTLPGASTLIPVGDSQTLTVQYRVAGVGVPGKTIAFTTTNGSFNQPSVTTDANGQASVVISSTTAAPATVLARIVGATTQTTLPLNFVATTPARMILQASPTAIGPNSGGTTSNQAQVLVKIVDASGNPVPSVAVNFTRTADPSQGNLSQPTATTDINGQASVQYIAGQQSTASGGVVVHAQVAGNAAVAADVALTVNQSALFIGLGTGNEITNIDSETYKKNWVIYVTDANGVPVSNKQLTVRVLPVSYGKGRLVFNSTVWVRASNSIECPNEDINYDGSRDAGEDVNNSLHLEPGNVIVVSPGSVTTDATGRATVSLIYAESYAPWVTVTLQASTVVDQSESSTSSTFTVSGSAADFTSSSVTPAGIVSPFGTNLSCLIPN